MIDNKRVELNDSRAERREQGGQMIGGTDQRRAETLQTEWGYKKYREEIQEIEVNRESNMI